MRRLLLCCLVLLPAAAAAQDVMTKPMGEINVSGAPVLRLQEQPALRIGNGWVAAISGPGDTLGYLTIVNTGAADRLVGAACSQAQGTTINEAKEIKESMAGMRPMDTHQRLILLGIDVPANGQLVLKPNGPHLRLQDIGSALLPGQQIGCRLDFQISGPMDVRMAVLRSPPQG